MKYASLAFLSSVLVAAQGTPPKLLTEALRRLPGLTILNPAVDLRDSVYQDEVQAARESHYGSWIKHDFDHDGLLDVVAAVTAHPEWETRFGVLAVLSKSPARVFWIVPLGVEPVYGVTVGHDVVEPLQCVACDANTWFRWSGRAFVNQLPTESDQLGVVDQDILAEPREGANVIVNSGPCVKVKVVDFRGAI